MGYVEDEETPESIARKFEELERIQSRLRNAAAASAAERPARDGNGSDVGPMSQDELSEEQLMEVFQQTSSFTASFASKACSARIAGVNANIAQLEVDCRQCFLTCRPLKVSL